MGRGMRQAVGPAPGQPRARSAAWIGVVLLFGALSGFFLYMYTAIYPSNDFLSFWLGTRAYLAGLDPYSAAATARIYPGQRSGFVYPFPAALLIVPFALLPAPLATALWAACGVTLYLLIPWMLRVRWPLHTALVGLLYVPLWAALEQAQWEPLLVGLVGLALMFAQRDRPFWSGFVVPLICLKPQIGLPVVCGFAVASVIERRWSWWCGVLAGFICWWGPSFLFLPAWPLGWLAQLRLFNGEGRTIVLAATAAIGPLTLIGLLGLLLFSAWRRDMILLFAATIVIGGLVTPTRFYNQLLLWIPILLVMRRRIAAGLLAALMSWLSFAGGLLGWGLVLSTFAGLIWPVIGALVRCLNTSPKPTRLFATMDGVVV